VGSGGAALLVIRRGETSTKRQEKNYSCRRSFLALEVLFFILVMQGNPFSKGCIIKVCFTVLWRFIMSGVIYVVVAFVGVVFTALSLAGLQSEN
jgi:hypothetical protein